MSLLSSKIVQYRFLGKWGLIQFVLRIYSYRKLTVQGAQISSSSVLDKLNF